MVTVVRTWTHVTWAEGYRTVPVAVITGVGGQLFLMRFLTGGRRAWATGLRAA